MAKAKPKPKPVTAQIEELASFQFTEAEVATMLGLEHLKEGPHLTAYKKGQLLAEAEVRKSILHHAKAGSAPAQKAFLDLVEKRERLKRKEVGRGS
jgi:hypothetical protein